MRPPRAAKQFARVLSTAAAIAGSDHANAQAGDVLTFPREPDLPRALADKTRLPLPEVWNGRALATADMKPVQPRARDLKLTMPLRDGIADLRDVEVHVTPDGHVRLDANQILSALSPALMPAFEARLSAKLSGRGLLPVENFAEAGIPILYDPAKLLLSAIIKPGDRAIRQLTVADSNRAPIGDFDPPAKFSGYINARGNADYKWNGQARGITSSRVQLDAAFRMGPVVLESEGDLTVGLASQTTTRFRRDGTRLVIDAKGINARITAGDLLPTSRGFAGTTQIAGIGIQRSYSVLQPQRNIQPNGSRSFTLTQASTVEAVVNGSIARRFRLDPGNYNLQDLPLSQGLNNVQLVVTNDSGFRETIDFSTYFDRSLLQPGLAEFGLYGGIYAPRTATGRSYRSGDPVLSGHFRMGISDRLTAGANIHARKDGVAAGVEAVVVTPLGPLGFDLAASTNRGFGSGFAVNAGLQRPLGGRRRGGGMFALNVEARSRRFSAPGPFLSDEPVAYDVGVNYSHRLAGSQVISLDGRFSKGRTVRDRWTGRIIYSHQIARNASLLTEALYERQLNGSAGAGIRFALIVRPSARSNASADYNSRSGFGRLSYATSGGDGVGSYFLNGDVEYAGNTVAASAGGSIITNRADFGLAHTASFAVSGNGIADERTSLRFGTALVMADGHFALGRPVFDSFALVRGHRTLDGAQIVVNPRASGRTANSGAFGGAVIPGLASYVDQAVRFTVPNAPAGYDLGAGGARVMPTYKSAYLVTVGSDYMVTALGTLLDRDGQPVALLAGEAHEVAHPQRKPVELFTNRAGRFGIQGLRAGKWRISMPTTPPGEVEIDIPDDLEHPLAQLGTLRLQRLIPRPEWGQ